MTPWHDAESQALRAMASADRALAAGDRRGLLQAIEALRAAIQVRPDELDWVVALARALDAAGDLRGSLAAYTDARRLDPEDPDLTLRHAALLRLAGSPAHALDLLTDLLAHHPQFEHAYCLKAQLHAETGQHELVDETYFLARTVTDECPRCDFAVAYSLVARCQTAAGIPSTDDASTVGSPPRRSARLAIPLLTRLLADPDHGIPTAQIHTLLARAHRRLSAFPVALRHYELALEHASLTEPPSATELHLELAQLHTELGNHLSALPHLQRAVEADPDDAVAALACAQAMWRSGHVEAAAALAETARSLDPTLAGACMLLARCALAKGDFPTARTCLAREARLNPTSRELLFELALLADDTRKPRLALQTCRRLLQLHPDCKPGWQNLALLLFRKRRYEEAITASYQALRLVPNDPATLHNLALALARRGDLDDALNLARDARACHPADSGLKHLCRRIKLLRLMRLVAGRR